MNAKNGKNYPENVGFAYKDVSKKGATYLSTTIDLAALGVGTGTVKLIGFITPQEQLDKGEANGKKVPHIRFIKKEASNSARASSQASTTKKTANKSELPF